MRIEFAVPPGFTQQPAGMMNPYRIENETTRILLQRRDGQAAYLLIDTVDLNRVLSLPGNIHLSISRSKRYELRYARISLDRKIIGFHRWLLDCPDDLEIDHLNHDGCDCRRRNLKITDRSGNMKNRRMKVWQSQKGVIKSNERERWAAVVWLGEFESAEAAERVYDEAHTILTENRLWEYMHGATAQTNRRGRVNDAPALYDWRGDTKRAS